MVSIIIPCFNQGRFLANAIDSALSQSYPEIEVIVVDDGSTDNTAAVTAKYPTVKYVRQHNQGLAGARDAGYRVSSGEYIEFLDADDTLTANAVQAHLDCLAANPDAGFVVGDIDHMHLDGSFAGSPRWPILQGNHYEELLRANHVANTIAVMFRRHVIDRLGGFKSFCSPAEDYELLLRAAQICPSAHHRTVVAHYRRHPASLSRQGALMLRAMNRVMRMNWPLVQGNPQLMKAWRQGDIYWRDHFGIAAIKELWVNLVRLDVRRVSQASFALVRYVRGRVFFLPWRYRGRLLRLIRRRSIEREQSSNPQRRHRAPMKVSK